MLAASDPGLREGSESDEAQSTGPKPTAITRVLHRYHAGEQLQMGNGGYVLSRAAALCRVVALLPYEGRGALLYRVRSEAEAFERVVAEGDLRRA